MNEDNPQIIFDVGGKRRTCLDTNVWLYIVYGFLCLFIFIYDKIIDCHGII